MTTDETRADGAPATWTFPGKYISVTTYKPVWIIQSALHRGRQRSTPVFLAITPRCNAARWCNPRPWCGCLPTMRPHEFIQASFL